MAPKRLRGRRKERDERGRAFVALALVAVRNRAEAERLRRAHASVLALYDERGRELDRLNAHVLQLEGELCAARVRAA